MTKRKRVPISVAIRERGQCVVCEAPIEKTDEHGYLINHRDDCPLTSCHPDSAAERERRARSRRVGS